MQRATCIHIPQNQGPSQACQITLSFRKGGSWPSLVKQARKGRLLETGEHETCDTPVGTGAWACQYDLSECPTLIQLPCEAPAVADC